MNMNKKKFPFSISRNLKRDCAFFLKTQWRTRGCVKQLGDGKKGKAALHIINFEGKEGVDNPLNTAIVRNMIFSLDKFQVII